MWGRATLTMVASRTTISWEVRTTARKSVWRVAPAGRPADGEPVAAAAGAAGGAERTGGAERARPGRGARHGGAAGRAGAGCEPLRGNEGMVRPFACYRDGQAEASSA